MSADKPYDLRPDGRGFLRLEFASGTEITPEMAEALTKDIVTHGAGVYRLLVVTGGLKDLGAIARGALARIEVPPSALAVVVVSLVDRILASTFIAHRRTKTYPALTFASESDAIEWLLAQ